MGLIDSIIGVESGGNPNATNPTSSASGLGQFIDSTWLSTIKQARPDLAQGKSDADLLALKTDPQLSRDMTEAYANQNQAILSKAGVPVTPGSTYLAHFAGPGGAVKVMQADPNAPVGDVLGAAVVKANPFLAGMTAKDLQAWADRKMGGSSPQPATAPASPPGAPLVLPSAQPPVFPQAAQAAPQAPQQAQQGDGGYFAQIPAESAMQAPPIQFAQRRPVNLAGLRNMLGSRAPIFPRG
jgi:hypothetical protein